jgi:ATP-dependent Clp protease ATP-binding subunit ClpB
VGLQLGHLARLVEAKQMHLEVTAEARALLAERGYDPVFGARPLKRVIQRLLQNPIALTLLEGGYEPGDTVVVRREGETLRFARERASAPAAAAS